MKLSHLLSDFLFQNRQIDLAGIGRFTLDDGATINFEQNASVKEDPNLVNYIAEKTGKMKSLVASDLDSHLELARQFLNIGKPYLFEGIGTLTKNKFAKYEFVPANAVAEKKESVVEGRDLTSTTESSFTDYEEMFSPKKSTTPAGKKLVTWLIAIAGLALAIFGGYLVYSKTKDKATEPISKKTEPVITSRQEIQTNPGIDTTQTIKKDPTPLEPPKDSIAGLTQYRFVIEQAARARAFYRYNKLKKDLINVKMDTRDSILFKLYFLLPSMPADTSKKRDSLQRLYGTRGRTIVELN